MTLAAVTAFDVVAAVSAVVLVVAFVAGIVLVVLELRNVPLGYEDAAGFHEGIDPDHAERLEQLRAANELERDLRQL